MPILSFSNGNQMNQENLARGNYFCLLKHSNPVVKHYYLYYTFDGLVAKSEAKVNIAT